MQVNTEFNLEEEYRKDKIETNENKTMWKGVLIMTIAAVVDWELFQWLYTLVQVKH